MPNTDSYKFYLYDQHDKSPFRNIFREMKHGSVGVYPIYHMKKHYLVVTTYHIIQKVETGLKIWSVKDYEIATEFKKQLKASLY